MPLSQTQKMVLSLFCCLLGLANSPVLAQMQTGRAVNGALWVSDQPLPAGVKSTPIELDQLMTLTPEPKASKPVPPTANTANTPNTPLAAPKQTAEEQATCRSINKRYAETKNTLEKTEQAKASGQLLIPDSGLTTMRQNLATLARMRALCQ